MLIRFYDNVDDSWLKFAVIISRSKGKWVLCKHKNRDTLELPGGHREPGEKITDTAKRELYEETGAVKYSIEPVCVYSVTGRNQVVSTDDETFGMLYLADIDEFEDDLHSEIERVCLLESLPDNWTYPLIQPKLIEEAINRELIK